MLSGHSVVVYLVNFLVFYGLMRGIRAMMIGAGLKVSSQRRLFLICLSFAVLYIVLDRTDFL